MAAIKPSVPKGTRDFSPAEMAKRNFIFDTIKAVFRKYGYLQIETPSMENLSTLTGKYGDEGDKLMFKILDSGEYIEKSNILKNTLEKISNLFSEDLKFKSNIENMSQENAEIFKSHIDKTKEVISSQESHILNIIKENLNSKMLTPDISEKALRYDLTVPFARYVVQHQNEITFPFKRFQVQPVWRADRPQKGRYREFFQCDADVVGSDSLLNEAEFILIYDEALSNLGLKDFTIKINNRKILSGIAEIIGKSDNIIDLTVAIDKLDKIGLDGVIKELLERGFTPEDIEQLKPVILLEGSNTTKLQSLRTALATSAIGLKGCEEIETVFSYINHFNLQNATIELDITLARGLNYYTGAIFEVKTNEVAMGSIGGGGRYDDLTGMFGLKGLTGAGISFGADRIYDVMEELDLFPEDANQSTRVLICCFDKDGELFALPLLQQLRDNDINTELYPAGAKIKKQLDYANNKNIPYTVVIGSDEMQSGALTFKDMTSGIQEKLTAKEIIEKLTTGL
ncbi:histidine--tRNA ligase [Mucilaginibacter corticis]|uniref:Histidine--tRNA ligase n=1 Tax=Mucilaginibacter corticis TaxID=2597670 RepID=A0A556MV85_9SPHI|nr:histidine--tRNA ligase [Mucilaginibacter corticis]TSJ43846.1 histidine--tRNA ligase [Mucilaginibacter corticis]